MKPISRFFCQTFNPQKPKEISYKSLVSAVNDQRIARIAKIAIFTFATMLTTATLVINEAQINAGPLNFILLGLTIFFTGLFLRLNYIDRRYTEFVDDETRSNLVKNEIERIFHQDCEMSEKEFTASLKTINRVLGNTVFDQDKIKTLNLMKIEAVSAKQPLSQLAIETNQTELLNFSSSCKWVEAGQFGLPVYEYEININWSLTPGSTEVIYKAAVKDMKQKEECLT